MTAGQIVRCTAELIDILACSFEVCNKGSGLSGAGLLQRTVTIGPDRRIRDASLQFGGPIQLLRRERCVNQLQRMVLNTFGLRLVSVR